MVDRYCFVKLLDGDVGERAAIAARLAEELAAVAGGGNVTVGLPADDSAARWDLSIVIRVGDLDAWRRLAADPRIISILDEWLPSRAAVVKAWTFELVDG